MPLRVDYEHGNIVSILMTVANATVQVASIDSKAKKQDLPGPVEDYESDWSEHDYA